MGAEHPHTLSCMGNLAVICGDLGRWKEAEKLTIQVVEMMTRILGVGHPNTLTNMGNLATIYRDQGQWVEAGWVLENNTALIQILESFDFARNKTFRIYHKPLTIERGAIAEMADS